MTQAVLFSGITAAQPPLPSAQIVQPSGPISNDPINLPGGSSAYKAVGGSGAALGSNQTPTFQVTVTSTQGNGVTVSATVNPIVSNDGANWNAGGIAPIVIASGPSPQTSVVAVANMGAAWYSAYCSAISGTGATVKCVLNV